MQVNTADRHQELITTPKAPSNNSGREVMKEKRMLQGNQRVRKKKVGWLVQLKRKQVCLGMVHYKC